MVYILLEINFLQQYIFIIIIIIIFIHDEFVTKLRISNFWSLSISFLLF